MVHDVDAVTFDFFNTLVRHQPGGGRGSSVMNYLRSHGLESDPWEHQVLYDVFEAHGREYSPSFSWSQREEYLVRLTERVFQRLNVRGIPPVARDHARAIWELIGPASLEVFPEVRATLACLRNAGYRLGVVSNWQCGLANFCEDLGLGGLFDEVLASAEVGCAKPDPEIFREACRRLQVQPDRVLHVGDTPEDDIDGAGRAGIRSVLVCREVTKASGVSSIQSLEEVPALLGVE